MKINKKKIALSILIVAMCIILLLLAVFVLMCNILSGANLWILNVLSVGLCVLPQYISTVVLDKYF